jgi:alanine dehydrogenase
MALYLKEEDVAKLVGVGDAISALETVFAEWGTDNVFNAPRQRIKIPQRAMNLMGASWSSGDICGHKAYFSGCFYVSLYSISQKRQLAQIEANGLGAIRTGAAGGLATKILAREDATSLGVIGSGRQAWTQVLAIAEVRKLETVRVFSRDETKREAFVAEIVKEIDCEVVAAKSAEACIRDADIAVTVTTSAEPVLFGDWLAPGTHLNATGANGYARREIDDAAVMRASIVSTDQRQQAKVEARELIDLTESGSISWDDVVEIGALLRGDVAGRKSEDQITLFKSLGIALEDIAIGKVIYERAIAAGVGQTFGPRGA